jgi:hypothetical protein
MLQAKQYGLCMKKYHKLFPSSPLATNAIHQREFLITRQLLMLDVCHLIELLLLWGI